MKESDIIYRRVMKLYEFRDRDASPIAKKNIEELRHQLWKEYFLAKEKEQNERLKFI